MKRRPPIAAQIRLGTEADIDEFVRIWQAIWRDSFAKILDVDANDPRFLLGMDHGEFIPIARDVIVATLAGRVVGFAHRKLAMIEDLWVEPTFQRRGVGRRLLEASVNAIATDGYRTASLDCLEANSGARRFYERENWRPAFRHVNWSQSLTRHMARIRFEYDIWRTVHR